MKEPTGQKEKYVGGAKTVEKKQKNVTVRPPINVVKSVRQIDKGFSF